MRITLFTILYMIFGIGIILGGRYINPIIENVGLWLSFFVIVYCREYIAKLLVNIPFPRFVVFIAGAIPFMMVEENINCLQSGCELIPTTIPVLLLFMSTVYFTTMRIKSPRFWPILSAGCLVGYLLELFFGSSHAAFLALSLPWFLYISLLVTMSCAYFMVIPLTFLINEKKNKSNYTDDVGV